MTYATFLSTVAVVLSSASPKKEPARYVDMWVDKFIRNPLWATLVGALVAAMVVSFFVFVQSGEAAPHTADERTPYASVSPLIVGGTAVPNGKYPFMAALLDKRRPGDAFDELFCGGTLIDKDSVLTAAHCLVNPKPDKLEVVVGRTALNQNGGQPRSVSHRFIHPRYNGNGYGYDAAILKLSRPVKSIKPIKLATAKQNNLEKPGHILTAAGWGVVKQRPGPFDIRTFRMRKVSVPVVSDSRAKRAYQSQGLKYFPSLQVAAGKKGKSVCFGDSGGPLFDSGSRTQVGITSYGAGGCGRTRYPEVYTEVNSLGIGKWILRTAKR